MNIHGIVNLESAEGIQTYIENVPVQVKEEDKKAEEGKEEE